MSDLLNIFKKYTLDKVENKYFNVYNDIFSDKVLEVKNLLEIGIGTTNGSKVSNMNFWVHDNPLYKHGNSLRAWRDYFQNANIYGIDVDNDVMFYEQRIKTFCSSSFDEEKMTKILDSIDCKLDVIIDDGLHTLDANLDTLKITFPYLNNGGIYVIEDVNQLNDYYIDNLLNDSRFIDTIGEHKFKVYDSFYREHTRMIVITK